MTGWDWVRIAATIIWVACWQLSVRAERRAQALRDDAQALLDRDEEVWAWVLAGRRDRNQ